MSDLGKSANRHSRHGDTIEAREIRDQEIREIRDQEIREIRIRSRSGLNRVWNGSGSGMDETEIRSGWSKFKDLTSLLAS